jgi:hypothetical protein
MILDWVDFEALEVVHETVSLLFAGINFTKWFSLMIKSWILNSR